MQSVNTVEYPTMSCKSRCAREVSPSIISSTYFSRFKEIRMQALVSLPPSLSLSLSLSLSTICFQSLQIVWMQKISDVLPNQIRGKQAYQELIIKANVWLCVRCLERTSNFASDASKEYNWAVTWDFQQCGMWDQQSLRSACVYAQSAQSLC